MSACLQEKWQEAPATEDRHIGFGAFAGASAFRAAGPALYQDIGPMEFRFGRWCLVPRARLLLCDDQSVELGSRAFDLLHLLLSKRGFVVEKTEIVSFVWPNTIVEESNLRFQMATLRKALGEDREMIKTIPGRGYIFAAEYKLAS
jgi:DNA-binding winged helix-turn-helix (wHTH) protein